MYLSYVCQNSKTGIIGRKLRFSGPNIKAETLGCDTILYAVWKLIREYKALVRIKRENMSQVKCT